MSILFQPSINLLPPPTITTISSSPLQGQLQLVLPGHSTVSSTSSTTSFLPQFHHLIPPLLYYFPQFSDPPNLLPAKSQLDPSIFVASPAQMQRATSASYSCNATNQSGFFFEAIECFVDVTSTDNAAKQWAIQKALEHQALLLPVIDNSPTPQHCGVQFKLLAGNAVKPFNPTSDDSDILLILESGETYLTCGAANFDVLRISAFFRSMLYQVGNAATPNEEMLLQGSTFVPSKKMTFIADEFKHLILFVLRTNPSLISNQLSQAVAIHDYVFNEFSSRMEQDELTAEASKRIIGTNILFGMMISILLEPSSQLKPNTLQLYLIGRGIKSVENRTHLTFHHANGMGKNCNSLLRLFRHFVCGHIVNTARDGAAPFNHDDFMKNTYQLLQTIQISISIDAVCRCIRMAKHIESKSGSCVKKGFDPNTGEVMVQQIYIPRVVWGRAIPTAVEAFRTHLFPLFRCHDILELVLNTQNKLVMAGEDVYVYINGEFEFVEYTHIIFCT